MLLLISLDGALLTLTREVGGQYFEGLNFTDKLSREEAEFGDSQVGSPISRIEGLSVFNISSKLVKALTSWGLCKIIWTLGTAPGLADDVVVQQQGYGPLQGSGEKGLLDI